MSGFNYNLDNDKDQWEYNDFDTGDKRQWIYSLPEIIIYTLKRWITKSTDYLFQSIARDK